MCARVPNLHSCRRPNCTPKVPNFGFGSHPCIQRETKKTREKERKAVGCCSTRKLCARKGEERERARSFNHEEVQREFVSKLTRYEYTSSSRQRVVSLLCSSSKKRKHRNCASPSDDNLFYDWGFVFFFASSSSCARCFVPVFSRSRANSANDDDSPF